MAEHVKSDVEAARWFRRAADQGMPVAQLNLGLMHAAGNGVATTKKVCAATKAAFGLEGEVFPSSTGVIGWSSRSTRKVGVLCG